MSDTQTITRQEFEKVVEALLACGFGMRQNPEADFIADSSVLWALFVEAYAGSAHAIIIDRLTEFRENEA